MQYNQISTVPSTFPYSTKLEARHSFHTHSWGGDYKRI